MLHTLYSKIKYFSCYVLSSVLNKSYNINLNYLELSLFSLLICFFLTVRFFFLDVEEVDDDDEDDEEEDELLPDPELELRLLREDDPLELLELELDDDLLLEL